MLIQGNHSILENMSGFDYKKNDYRAFIICRHNDYGILLLHCTRKKKKGPHFQLPGGHIDEPEFLAAARQHPANTQNQLLVAAKMGGARELFEETGIDVRKSALERLEAVELRDKTDHKHSLSCELHHRLYFMMNVDDSDFPLKLEKDTKEKIPIGFYTPMKGEGGHLMLKLSHEHSGFLFEPNMTVAAQMIQPHSGGYGSKALKMLHSHNEL